MTHIIPTKTPPLTNKIQDEHWYEFPKEISISKYLISDKGRLWSKKLLRLKHCSPSPAGYLSTTISDDNGKNHAMFLHRLVALALIPNPNNYDTVDHIDRNRTNNVIENLRWASRYEQAKNQKKAKTISGGRQVDQYTMDGKYIKTWKSVQEAGCAMAGIKNVGQTISNVCNNNNRRKTGYGYIWKYTPIKDLDGEEWKPIPNITGYYASTKGRIRKGNSYGAELLKGTITGQYRIIRIEHKTYPLHVLICSTFIGQIPKEKYEVNHINGNTLDNRPENLEWMSHHDNVKHASQTGLIDHKKMGKVVSKKVNKYSINGTFICSYPSVTIATESNPGSNHISEVCRNRKNHLTSGGFKWKYADFDYDS